jgi:hypothetical protein
VWVWVNVSVLEDREPREIARVLRERGDVLLLTYVPSPRLTRDRQTWATREEDTAWVHGASVGVSALLKTWSTG